MRLIRNFGMRMGDYFEGFVQEEARKVGKTVEEIGKWTPPEKPRKARVARAKKGPNAAEDVK